MVDDLLATISLPATPDQLRVAFVKLGWDEELGASVLVRAEDGGVLEWDTRGQRWVEPEPLF
jgi:hypothetical protein